MAIPIPPLPAPSEPPLNPPCPPPLQPDISLYLYLFANNLITNLSLRTEAMSCWTASQASLKLTKQSSPPSLLGITLSFYSPPPFCWASPTECRGQASAPMNTLHPLHCFLCVFHVFLLLDLYSHSPLQIGSSSLPYHKAQFRCPWLLEAFPDSLAESQLSPLELP